KVLIAPVSENQQNLGWRPANAAALVGGCVSPYRRIERGPCLLWLWATAQCDRISPHERFVTVLTKVGSCTEESSQGCSQQSSVTPCWLHSSCWNERSDAGLRPRRWMQLRLTVGPREQSGSPFWRVFLLY